MLTSAIPTHSNIKKSVAGMNASSAVSIIPLLPLIPPKHQDALQEQRFTFFKELVHSVYKRK
jgi:hypothetical protein